MKAIQLEKPGSFRVIDIDEPPAPGPGEAATCDTAGVLGPIISIIAS
jgi:hypothetical protein